MEPLQNDTASSPSTPSKPESDGQRPATSLQSTMDPQVVKTPTSPAAGTPKPPPRPPRTLRSPVASLQDDKGLARGPSVRSARDSLDLAQKRWEPLSPRLSSDEEMHEQDSQPAIHPLKESTLRAVSEGTDSAAVTNSDAATDSGDALPVPDIAFPTGTDTDGDESDTRRSLPSRARAKPGYVHSTRSPPTSVKGAFESLQEHYKAVQDAQQKYGVTLDEPPRIGIAWPPMTPPPVIDVSEPAVPDFLKSPPPPTPRLPPIAPTLALLHSVIPLRQRLLYLLPALAFSMGASAIQPLISIIVGDTFAALAAFPRDHSLATPEMKSQLMRDVGWTSLKLLFLGAGNMAAEYLVNVSWVHYGETVAAHLRTRVYDGVRTKPMEWYDTGMGMEEEKKSADAVGSGGLMGKFARETDDVRMATSLATGLTVQYASAFLVCFILALVKLPLLALATMASLPLIVILNFGTQRLANVCQIAERRAFTEASTTVERTTAAISTVKAHNAQEDEVTRFRGLVLKARDQLVRQSVIWANSYAWTDFLVMIMFVIGFWYGAKLVNSGEADVGEVMTVFWACLLGASSLQSTPPQFMIINKGKASLASLLTVIQETQDKPSEPESQRVTPRCRGAFDFHNVFFAYPSRPTSLVLRGINVFLPAGETTFIVGGSGSGKSTIAALLLRLYAPQAGDLSLDDHPLSSFESQFTQSHIAAVQQGCLIFDMSVHDNVAMGVLGADESTYGRVRRPEDITRAEVIDACKMAYIHDFIESLPHGYDTQLGNNGSQLSGGQKQRLAIARARIRDPTVLILDEATAALDATSRVEVFEAIRAWRDNSTTIVITHDLSQITPSDFVYVMKDGVVVEQGFRRDLVELGGTFAEMAAEQSAQPLPVKLDFSWCEPGDWNDALDDDDSAEFDALARLHTTTFRMSMRPQSVAVPRNRDSVLIRPRSMSFGPAPPTPRHRSSSFGHDAPKPHVGARSGQRQGLERSAGPPAALDTRHWRASTQSLPQGLFRRPSSSASVLPRALVRGETPDEKVSMEEVAETIESDEAVKVKFDEAAISPRPRRRLFKRKRQAAAGADDNDSADPEKLKVRGFFALMWHLLPTIPHKPVLAFGAVTSIARGVATPVWSYFLAQLMALLGTGNNHEVGVKSGILIGIVACQALLVFAHNASLASLAAVWTAQLRCSVYKLVLGQDRGWFDEDDNSPPRLVQGVIKDVDDMRHLVATILPRAVVCVCMVGLGFVWSLAVGWQLALVALAALPVFGAVGVFSTITLSKAEVYNKARREAVSRLFFESVANVRGIRAMALERSFTQRFAAEAKEARKSAQKAIWTTAIGLSINMSMPLFAQALLNYVGAVYIRNGIMGLDHMLQVYTLVLFSVTFAAGMLGFMPLLTKAKVAAADFERFRLLSPLTSESQGSARFPITGEVEFQNLSFAYPTRPTVPVLTDLSFRLSLGEVVAIVGPSGSGKSTIAALLQRLYPPSSGSIRLGGHDLAEADVRFARDSIAVVSQTPHLFDASIADNIRYGSSASLETVVRAAKEANIHDFVAGLPQGYETRLGENAALISGGQAQRLQIARALLRHATILILDEATSALDVENQHTILDTIVGIKANHTTIFITHSVDVMRRCDRIICLGDGRVAEDGTYAQLIARGGTFAQLMQTGEWQ